MQRYISSEKRKERRAMRGQQVQYMPLEAFAFRFSPRFKHNRTIVKLNKCPLLLPGQIFHAHGLLLPQRAPVERAAERAARDGPADRAPRLHVALRRQGQGGPDRAGTNFRWFWLG